jgi:hypothetical protein
MAAGEGATQCTERATLPVDQYQPVRHGLYVYSEVSFFALLLRSNIAVVAVL